MMMRHMWIKIYSFYIYLYAPRAYLCLGRCCAQTHFFILFLLRTRRVAAHLLLISGTKKSDGKTFPWRERRCCSANVRKAGIFYWTSAIYSGSNIRKCLYPQHVDNYNKNTFDDLMRTQCIKKLQFPTSAARRAKVANRNCVCWVRELKILSTYGENERMHQPAAHTLTPVSIRNANHSTQNFGNFQQTPLSTAGCRRGWVDGCKDFIPSICAHNAQHCFAHSINQGTTILVTKIKNFNINHFF